MRKTYKDASSKSRDFEKLKQSKKKPKHSKLEPYNRKRARICL